jgi:hypothetical protein
MNELTQRKLETGSDSEKQGLKIRREVPFTDLIHHEVRRLYIDEIDSFAEVRKVPSFVRYTPTDEKWFKEGLKKILGEIGTFQDWGGETNDLFTTITLNETKLSAAFALKGKGIHGILQPKDMGTRGNQLQRLLNAPADAFFVQHWHQIGEDVVDLLRKLAEAKASTEHRRIFFGLIDGADTQRIILAYKECFS